MVTAEMIEKIMPVNRMGSLPWLSTNKFFGRHQLAGMFNTFGLRTGAEIGVRIGLYSKVLFNNIDGLKLYCVDTWAPWSGGKDTQEKQNEFFQTAQEVLAPHDATFLRKTSMDALLDIPDRSLDFVYIDGAHDFDNVMMDIIGWSKKVKKGGIVSGHDYTKSRKYEYGIIDATNAYAKAHNIFPWYLTNLGTRAERERTPSWLWINP